MPFFLTESSINFKFIYINKSMITSSYKVLQVEIL